MPRRFTPTIGRQLACVTVAVFLATFAVSSNAFAQVPQPDEDAVDIAEFAGAEEDQAPADPNAPRALGFRVPNPQAVQAGYFSPKLRGTFLAQWMKITQNGRTSTFWGARILNLQPKSPLRTLGLQPGDVVTRLDGISIANGMYRQDPSSPYELVEMEEHYGQTTVRLIYKSTQVVREGDIDLGPPGAGGGGGGPAPIDP